MPLGEKTKELWKNPVYREHMIKVHKGKKPNNALEKWKEAGGIPWNKGKHIQTNDALKKWKENGGQPWNKGTKGLMLVPWNKGKKLSEEHKAKLKIARKKIPIRNWKGGIIPINTKIRTSIEFRLWREAVFARNNWVCQKCKIRGNCYLIAHHIQNFAQYPELRFAINNGITFCKNCHKLFHKKYGRKNNTKKQLEEFLCQEKHLKFH